MSEKKSKIGLISWVDLTVENADEAREFYAEVVGWKIDPVPMEGYEDYCMLESGGEAVAGVCHARGTNAGLPPQWIIYLTVADLDKSMESCRRLGGEIIVGPKSMGPSSRYCVIKDPAGAVSALFEETG